MREALQTLERRIKKPQKQVNPQRFVAIAMDENDAAGIGFLTLGKPGIASQGQEEKSTKFQYILLI